MHVRRVVIVDLISISLLRQLVDLVNQILQLFLPLLPRVLCFVRPALQSDRQIEIRVIVNRDRDASEFCCYAPTMCRDVTNGPSPLMLGCLIHALRN